MWGYDFAAAEPLQRRYERCFSGRFCRNRPDQPELPVFGLGGGAICGASWSGWRLLQTAARGVVARLRYGYQLWVMIPTGSGQLGNTRRATVEHRVTTTGAVSAPAAPITAADQARIDHALRDARAANTRRQYRSAWKGWAEWAGLQGHQVMPADPAAVAAYLAERTEQGAAASTVRTIRAAIAAAHRDAGAADPTAHDGVRRVLHGLTRQAAGRGRGQAQGLTADDCAAILATASIPRRTGRGMETGWVVPIGSGGAPLGRRAGRNRRSRGAGLRPPLENRSGRHRRGRALPQERVRRGEPDR